MRGKLSAKLQMRRNILLRDPVSLGQRSVHCSAQLCQVLDQRIAYRLAAPSGKRRFHYTENLVDELIVLPPRQQSISRGPFERSAIFHLRHGGQAAKAAWGQVLNPFKP